MKILYKNLQLVYPPPFDMAHFNENPYAKLRLGPGGAPPDFWPKMFGKLALIFPFQKPATCAPPPFDGGRLVVVRGFSY